MERGRNGTTRFAAFNSRPSVLSQSVITILHIAMGVKRKKWKCRRKDDVLIAQSANVLLPRGPENTSGGGVYRVEAKAQKNGRGGRYGIPFL